jgi:uncharacterized protein (TIGR03790 family)
MRQNNPAYSTSVVYFFLVVTIFCGICQAESKSSLKSVEPVWSGKEMAVIVNDNDSLSRQIANYYRDKRGIPSGQVIHVKLRPDVASVSPSRFEVLLKEVKKQTPSHVQGYVLTWIQPYRVKCMSITTAFATGFDEAFCATGCKETRHNPYYDSASRRPYDDFGWRPAMVLAAESFTEAKQLIDRGLAADYSQPKGSAYLLKTTDAARSSRALSFPSLVKRYKDRLPVHYLEKNFIENKRDVMFYFTGLTHVPRLFSNDFLPGAVADHLTSGGGILRQSYQMSAVEWLRAGATGSYGTVVEPCSFPQKFPNPDVLMEYYLKGNTLLEAYWKSVAEPGQGIFIGDPLAKPYAHEPR